MPLSCRMIYSGHYAKVYIGVISHDTPPVAVKIYRDTHISPSFELQALENEISVLCNIKHPHIIPLLATWSIGDARILAYPLYREGDMQQNAARFAGSEKKIVRQVVAPLLSALSYMHAAGLVHRDVKVRLPARPS